MTTIRYYRYLRTADDLTVEAFLFHIDGDEPFSKLLRLAAEETRNPPFPPPPLPNR